ncbi:transposase [Elysia marginata]|uniref:Transposase n=1 Tax=Elysia marginata TaxID=1093978 RepID=A0AAV4H1G1_9GAST|nr:transposase [Elysia marginata]
MLAGRNFDRIQDLAKAVNSELRTIPEEDYQGVFRKWHNRLKRCIESHGEYMRRSKSARRNQNTKVLEQLSSPYYKQGNVLETPQIKPLHQLDLISIWKSMLNQHAGTTVPTASPITLWSTPNYFLVLGSSIAPIRRAVLASTHQE